MAEFSLEEVVGNKVSAPPEQFSLEEILDDDVPSTINTLEQPNTSPQEFSLAEVVGVEEQPM